MTRYGFIFPGQGSQVVGMGQAIIAAYPEYKKYVEKADQILGFPLSEVMFNGPQETLTLTEYAQPAIFVVSAILADILKSKSIIPEVVAGHSLGEITSYYVAGALSYEEALTVIKVRGAGMASSCPPGKAGMAAIMGTEPDVIETVIAPFKDSPVCIANYNCPGQIVISGERQGLEKAILALKENRSKCIPLRVSGAFHSPMMIHAKDVLTQHLSDATLSKPTIPIILNRSAETEVDIVALKNNLPEQVISPVKWIQSMQKMASLVDVIVEVGSGSVLTGLLKKINSEQPKETINSVEKLELFLAS